MARLLVVDDDADIRLLLRYELAAEGHQVAEAADGREALSAIRSSAPDLVVLDIMMPVLDGWGVLRELREVPEVPEVPPIVIITALQTVGDAHVAELLELGALDVVAKPFEPGWLVDLVAAVLLVAPDEREQYRQGRLDQARGR